MKSPSAIAGPSPLLTTVEWKFENSSGASKSTVGSSPNALVTLTRSRTLASSAALPPPSEAVDAPESDA